MHCADSDLVVGEDGVTDGLYLGCKRQQSRVELMGDALAAEEGQFGETAPKAEPSGQR